MTWEIFSDVLDIFTGAGEVLGDIAGGFQSLTGNGDSLWGDVLDLAGSAFLEGSQFFIDQKKSEQALKAGESEAGIYNSNADLLNTEAEEVFKRTGREALKATLEGYRLLSRQRTSYLKAGVTLQGTPLMVMDETKDMIDLGVQEIYEDGNAKEKRLRAQAGIEEQKAQNALDRAEFSATTNQYQSYIDLGSRMFNLG